MAIKHTHPTYESEESRLDELKEIQRTCFELILKLQKKETKIA